MSVDEAYVCMYVCMYVCVFVFIFKYKHDDEEVRGFMERLAATLEVYI